VGGLGFVIEGDFEEFGTGLEAAGLGGVSWNSTDSMLETLDDDVGAEMRGLILGEEGRDIDIVLLSVSLSSSISF
jgi:hypothetical protein